MSLKHRVLLALIPLAALLVWIIGMTLKIRLVDPNRLSPYAKPGRSFIYSFWHNQQILSTFVFRGFGIHVLVSRSQDGDFIAKTLEWFGFKTVRSSTSQGKVNALRGLDRALHHGHYAAITPDGPRGPVYQAQPGAVFLGALARTPIVPFGCAVDRVWRLRSWDQFEIPKPFSRAVLVFGETLEVPRNLEPGEAERLTLKLQTRMNALRDQAREILASGKRVL